MKREFVFAFLLVFANVAAAQDSIRWKWNGSSDLFRSPLKHKNPQRSHLAVEFAAPPTALEIEQLREAGAVILSPLSNRALLISVFAGFAPQGAGWAGSFAPESKISPLIRATSERRARSEKDPFFVVAVYPDVDIGDARSIILESGLRIVENPDLLPN